MPFWKKTEFDSFIKTFLGVFLVILLFGLFSLKSSMSLPASNTLSSPKIPIIMYHSVLNDNNRLAKYVITPKKLEEDFAYLKENGFTPINSKDLINFSLKGVSLPEKPVIITFDDGYYNNYSYAYPLLKKYNFKAVFSVVGKYSSEFSEKGAVLNNNYSHIPFDVLREISLSGLVEIANHSYNMHDFSKRKGILRKKGEDKEEHKELLILDTTELLETLKQRAGVTPIAYTYPFGAVNNDVKEIIESLGYQVTYGCEEGLNIITNHPETLHDLKRFNRDGRLTTKEFFDKILK